MKQGYREPKPIINGVSPKMICELQSGDRLGCHTHYHTYIELIYCLNGAFNVWLNSRHYTFQTGDLLVINSNEVHAIQSAGEGASAYIVLRFEPEILYDSSQNTFNMKYVLPFIIDNVTLQKIFTHEEMYADEIPKLMHDALDEYKNRRYGYELAIRSDICRIFVWILRHWHDMGIEVLSSGAAASEHIKSLQRVLDFMSEHYSENISANDMAKLANMSYSYFSKVFSQVMNRSFNDYLNYIRITEAEKLLMSTDMNITQIAVETGFSSSSYFIKIFDKYKKASPTQFRKKFLSEHTGLQK